VNKIVELAWAEVKQDPRHRIRIQTRLRLYDELIGDMDTSISQLVKAGEFRFPRKTPGLKRLGYLGIITVEPLFPAWEQEMDRIVQMEPEMEPVRLFPYDMLSVARQLLKGKRKSEIVFDNEYWTSISGWHYFVGNTYEDVSYQHYKFLKAVHRVYTVLEGWLPIQLVHSELTESTYDEDLKTPVMENRDFAYHALQATICRDPNEPGWNKPRDLPIKRDNEKALAFWRQWLFERVPDAATVDLDQLDKTG
jgi:hypothetical protein